MKVRNGIFIPFLMFFIVLLHLNTYATGESGVQFLKIGVGAKACAMGEAFVGLADDPSAIYWNPAGLAQMSSFELMGMQNFWLLDMSYQYFAVVLPSHYGSFGAAITYSSSGEIPKYEDFKYMGEYTAYDAAGTFAYANNLGKGISLGLGVKFIQQKIEEEKANGFGVDIGLIYELGFIGGTNIGFAVQNLGPGIKFIEEKGPLPLNVKGGIAYKIGSLTLASDLNKPKDNDFRVNLGGEFLIKDVLAMRAGYNSANTYSVGVGLIWRSISIEYAYVPYEDIDDSHQISAGIKF